MNIEELPDSLTPNAILGTEEPTLGLPGLVATSSAFPWEPPSREMKIEQTALDWLSEVAKHRIPQRSEIRDALEMAEYFYDRLADKTGKGEA